MVVRELATCCSHSREVSIEQHVSKDLHNLSQKGTVVFPSVSSLLKGLRTVGEDVVDSGLLATTVEAAGVHLQMSS